MPQGQNIIAQEHRRHPGLRRLRASAVPAVAVASRAGAALLAAALAAGLWASPNAAPAVAAASSSQHAPAGTRRALWSAEQAHPALSLLSQTSWVDKGRPMIISVATSVSAPTAQLALDVFVYPRLQDRTDFAMSVKGQVFGVPIWTHTFPLSSLRHGVAGSGSYTITVPTSGPDAAAGFSAALAGGPGVYPVVVELGNVARGTRLARFTTQLIYAPTRPASPKLGLAWVQPVTCPVKTLASGQLEAPGSCMTSISVLSAALARYHQVPVNLAPSPMTLQLLAHGSGSVAQRSLAELRAAGRRSELLAQPFAPVSLSSLARARLGQLARSELLHGQHVVSAVLGRAPVWRTFVPLAPAGPSGLRLLAGLGVHDLVLPGSTLSGLPTSFTVTLANPFYVSGTGLAGTSRTAPEALSANSGLAGHFTNRGNQVLAAHQLLADLAQIYFDDPHLVRAVAVVAPVTWRPSNAFLSTALSGLASSPLVSAMSVSQALRTVPVARRSGGAPLTRRVTPRPLSRLPSGAALHAYQLVTAFSSAAGAANPEVHILRQDVLAAVGYPSAPSSVTRSLGKVGSVLSAQLAKLQVINDRTVTLTSATGQVPITVVSGLGYPLHAVVRLVSSKLRFPGGPARTVTAVKHDTTLRFPVKARASGIFPLRVEVTSPSGHLVLARARLSIRSTAASLAGVALSVGALSFLFVWWVRTSLRGRRKRNRRLMPPLQPLPPELSELG